jgi:hypothetical protein
MPPTPPPDIDIEAWHDSEKKLLAWDPDTLFLTHFGPSPGTRQHLQAMFANLSDWSRIVRRLIADEARSEEDRQTLFVNEVYSDIRRQVGEQEAEAYVRAGGLGYSWQGLARYWRKRTAA